MTFFDDMTVPFRGASAPKLDVPAHVMPSSPRLARAGATQFPARSRGSGGVFWRVPNARTVKSATLGCLLQWLRR
jgi:hypothetical protein